MYELCESAEDPGPEDELMTVNELIDQLTAQAAALPDGLDTQVLGGVEDDVDQHASIYTHVDVAVHEMARRGGGATPALWVRGVLRIRAS